MRMAEFPSYEPIVRHPEVFFPEPLIAAAVTGVTDGTSGVERLLALGAPALKEAVSDAGLQSRDLRNAHLYLAAGQQTAAAEGTRLASVLAPRLVSRLGRTRFARAHYLPRGSAGVLLALQKASDDLRKRLCNYCVIGAVHSWLDADTLAWLDGKRRLKSPGNVDAFVPARRPRSWCWSERPPRRSARGMLTPNARSPSPPTRKTRFGPTRHAPAKLCQRACGA
jgi:hypothetical protein